MRIVFENKDLLDMGEASKALGISRMTLWRWLNKGKITAVKIGKYRGIHKDEVERVKGDNA